MGKTQRKYSAEMTRFRKQLKKPFKQIALLMPPGFVADDYVNAFRRYCPHLWQDVNRYYHSFQQMDRKREKKGLKRLYNFPSPFNFVKRNARPLITRYQKQPSTINEEEKERIKYNLEERAKEILSRRNKKSNHNMRLVQTVKPTYLSYFEQTYFKLKRNDPSNVDDRFAVVIETSIFKCPDTIRFLHKVNDSERNYHIRHKAFSILQSWGEIVRLRANRNGKKRYSDTIIPTLVDSPESLLRHIETSQLEQHKYVNLFVSHSYSNAEDIVKIKTQLNANNLSVYVAWMNDQHGLKRSLIGENTEEVLRKRIENSQAIFFVITAESIKSKWTEWECEVADKLGKKVIVYNYGCIVDLPSFLQHRISATLHKYTFYISTGYSKMTLWEFINKH